jgi:hypothetical protein
MVLETGEKHMLRSSVFGETLGGIKCQRSIC